MNLSEGNVPSQSEIPCGKTLDLYAGTSNGGCLSKPGENSASYPVLNMTKMKEDTDIPVLGSREGKDIKKRDGISHEYGFSIDTELVSEIFKCIFIEQTPFICEVAFRKSSLQMGESSTEMLCIKTGDKLATLPSKQEYGPIIGQGYTWRKEPDHPSPPYSPSTPSP